MSIGVLDKRVRMILTVVVIVFLYLEGENRMRVHKDIDKVGLTVYRWTVQEEAPSCYIDGVPEYEMNLNPVASGECTKLATAKMCATNAARRHDWKPDHLCYGRMDRVTYERSDENDPQYGHIVWVNDEYDDRFYGDGMWNADRNAFDWEIEDERAVAG